MMMHSCICASQSKAPKPLPEGTALAVQTVDADSTLLSASASSGAEQWIVRADRTDTG